MQRIVLGKTEDAADYLSSKNSSCSRVLLLAGFIDDIQGMNVGERRELDYTLPDTWWEPSIKGTEVTCNVALKELFMWELPKASPVIPITFVLMTV